MLVYVANYGLEVVGVFTNVHSAWGALITAQRYKLTAKKPHLTKHFDAMDELYTVEEIKAYEEKYLQKHDDCGLFVDEFELDVAYKV